MTLRQYGITAGLILALGGPVCFAEGAPITPIRALSTQQFGNLSSYKQHSEGRIAGAGSMLRIRYSSSIDLKGYIAILHSDETYNPADLYYYTLPAGHDATALIDISALTVWTPFTHEYLLSFLSNSEHTDTQFQSMTFEGGGLGGTILAGLKHVSSIEPYWISSAHLLRGYRILNVPFAVLLGVIVVGAAGIFFLRRKKSAAIIILIAGMLSYDARFVTDLTIYSVSHLQSFISLYRYGEAGDAYAVSDALIADAKKDPGPAASVCFGSTDYYAKLVRYLAYPIPVTLTGTLLPNTTHVIVSHHLNWRYENGVLHCDTINHAAMKIKSFDDGTVLFRIPSS